MASSDRKPAVIIVGGLGFIGRHLAKYIHDNDLASDIRIVDKLLPQLAYLAPEFQNVCTPERCVQADASQESFFPKIFDREPGLPPFDYLFSCGGEARFSSGDEAFRIRSYMLAVNLGREAMRRKIPAIVECSTGLIYKQEGSKPRKETDALKPSSALGQFRLKASQDLQATAGEGPLNMVVLRFPNVYGPYSLGLLMTIVCMARCFQETGTEMKWLWDEELRCHTVHVHDAVRAMWTAAEYRARVSFTPTADRKWPVFNIVDHNDTSQKTLANLTKAVFGIPTGFHSKLVSAFARMNLDSLVDNVNKDTLGVWAELQERQGVKAGPIGPYMEVDLLREQHLCLDGAFFEKTMNFTYQRPTLGEDELREVIESYKRMGWWPA